MKKLFFVIIATMVACAAYAQSYSILPADGKLFEYTTKIKSPMMPEDMSVKATQYLKSKTAAEATIISNSAETGDVEISYQIKDGKLTIDMEKSMKALLGQIGNLEVIEKNGNQYYPMELKPNTNLDAVSMKIKGNMMGMDIEMELEIKNRVIGEVEKVEVPAGTFDAIKVEETTIVKVMGQTQEVSMITWYGAGIGMVKQSTENPMGFTTVELVKISDK